MKIGKVPLGVADLIEAIPKRLSRVKGHSSSSVDSMARLGRSVCFQALQVLRSCSHLPLPFRILATSREMHTAARQTYTAARQTYLATRLAHTAVVLQRDLQNDLDSNPFYDKYKKKLEKIRG